MKAKCSNCSAEAYNAGKLPNGNYVYYCKICGKREVMDLKTIFLNDLKFIAIHPRTQTAKDIYEKWKDHIN